MDAIDEPIFERVALSLTQQHSDRLRQLARLRTLGNRSLLLRTLIDEEWERRGLDKSAVSGG